jgi:hypothetical protein
VPTGRQVADCGFKGKTTANGKTTAHAAKRMDGHGFPPPVTLTTMTNSTAMTNDQ